MDKQGDRRLIFRACSFRKWYYQKARTEQYQSTNKQGKYSRVNTAENNLISVLKLKENTLQRIERLTEERMEISRLIDKLANPLERSVLRFFYLNDLVASEVAEEIGKSTTSVYRVKQKAIENLANVGE